MHPAIRLGHPGPAHSVNGVDPEPSSTESQLSRIRRPCGRSLRPVRLSRSLRAARLAVNAPVTSDGQPHGLDRDTIPRVHRVRSMGCLPDLAEKQWADRHARKSPLPGGLRNQYAAARSVTRAIAANASQTVMGRRGVGCAAPVSLSATSRAVGRALHFWRASPGSGGQALPADRGGTSPAGALPFRLSACRSARVFSDSTDTGRLSARRGSRRTRRRRLPAWAAVPATAQGAR